MSLESFYRLNSPSVDDDIVTDGAWGPTRTDIDCGYCPWCNGILGMLRTRPPLDVELENWGFGFADFVWMPGWMMLINETVLLEIQRNGMFGFGEVIGKAIVTKVRNHKRSFKGSPPTYYGVEVGFGRPAIDLFASGIRYKTANVCGYCLEAPGIIAYLETIVIDLTTWRGEDMFRPRGRIPYIMLSRRMSESLREMAVTGISLTPASELHDDQRDIVHQEGCVPILPSKMAEWPEDSRVMKFQLP